MKGHLELFENRLKQVAEGILKDSTLSPDELFSQFEEALGKEIPFYDVHSGVTLADYYQSQFVQFVKRTLKK